MNRQAIILVAGLLAGCADNPSSSAVESAALLEKQSHWFERCVQGMERPRALTLMQYRAEGWVRFRGRSSAGWRAGDEAVLTCDEAQKGVAVTESPWWFVGYGRSIPALGLDDYAAREVRGQTVIILADAPVLMDMPVDSIRALESAGRYDGPEERPRITAALSRGVALVVMVVSEERWRERRRFPLEWGMIAPDGAHEARGLVVWISEVTWQRWMHRLGQDPVALKAQATAPGFRPLSLPVQSQAEWDCLAHRTRLAMPRQ